MNRDGRDDAADIDRAFADIMSRWDQTAHRDERPEEAPEESPAAAAVAEPSGDAAPTPEPPPQTTQPPGDEEPRDEQAPEGPESRRPRTVEEVFGSARDTGWRVHTPPEEDDEFVAPRPAPPSGNDVTFWLALIGIVGGPLWLIYLALAAPYSSRLWFVLAIAATLGGFGLMVMRLPARRDPEDDEDDGAVV